MRRVNFEECTLPLPVALFCVQGNIDGGADIASICAIADRIAKVARRLAAKTISPPHSAGPADNGGWAVLDTLIVFAVLGSIAVFVVYVLPRQGCGKHVSGEYDIFPE